MATHCRGVVVPILGDRLPPRMAAVEQSGMAKSVSHGSGITSPDRHSS
ncbi:hypothetical protein [Nitrincola sp. MINF-07-Sa-05]